MVAKHSANTGFGLCFDHVPHCFQRIKDRFAGQRRVHRIADEDWAAPVSGKLTGFNDARCHGRSEQLCVPVMVIAFDG
jgi:hypothetical protein